MSKTVTQPKKRWPGWRVIYLTILLVATGGLLLTALVSLQPTSPTTLDLQVGTVAPIDIMAPIATAYESQVLTEQQREAAARAIRPIYTPPDTQVARQQVERLRSALTFITTTRADEFASHEQKLADLALLGDAFDPEIAETVLSLSDEQWQAVQQETVLVLQQVMRSTIREDQLDDARRSIPTLVSFSLPEEQAETVADLARIFLAPNSFYSEGLTEEKRQQTRDAVSPITRSFVRGETVVRRGKVLTETDLEALQQFGLLPGGNDKLNALNAAILVVLSMAFPILYLYRQPSLQENWRQIVYIGVFFLIFLFAARMTILGHTVLPYFFPATAYGLLIAVLFGDQTGIIFSISLSLLITHGMPNSLELTIYYILSSIFAILMLGRAQRIVSYFWAGLAAAVLGASVILAFQMLDPFTDLVGLLTLSGASLANGIISAILAILLHFFTAPFLGTTTILQLMELSRPDHPLLRFILMNAPGTYQHSLQVSNLAEQAAERIGADPMLTRVGALYHDAGKALNPQCFIENQAPGAPNIHESLIPLESSTIIIRHVTDGLELARKHRLPPLILNFISEHHGTMITRYQYIQAIQEAGGDKSLVDKEVFRYPGPQPQSRETALVMLADGCEARARAERPKTKEQLQELVKDTIDTRLALGQLDDTELTTRDLKTIIQSFTATLRGIYHPRIEYPKLNQ
ncbi:MAG: HD family phosphohydrolase [Anaerolineales bacterium]